MALRKIKGLVVIAEPSIFKMGRDPYYALVDMLCERYGFTRMELTENSRILDNFDLVINYSNTRNQIIDLSEKVKLITWMGDVNVPPGTPEEVSKRVERRRNLFRRSDVILSAMGSYFRKEYPQFIHKMVFFPKHYGYMKNFAGILFNDDPIMKCLLSGSTSQGVYPFRAYVRKNLDPAFLDKRVSTVPGAIDKGVPPWRQVGREYAKMLNSYFCCFTDSSIYGCMVGKYFEIPAAGSLLIANRTEDSDEAGFVPGIHYVDVTKENVLKKIRNCLMYPKTYNEIRMRGMRYIRAFHGPDARFKLFERVIEEVMG